MGLGAHKRRTFDQSKQAAFTCRSGPRAFALRLHRAMASLRRGRLERSGTAGDPRYMAVIGCSHSRVIMFRRREGALSVW